MTWKFWQQHKESERLELENAVLKARLQAADQRGPCQGCDPQQLMLMASFDEDFALWKAILYFTDQHERIAKEVALRPGLADGERQFNAGYAASAYDFACFLRQARLKGEQELKKLERGK